MAQSQGKLIFWRSLGVSVGAILLAQVSPVRAAEQVRLNYGPLSRRVDVADLRTLADTGKPPKELRAYLRLAKQEPAEVQRFLTKPLNVEARVLDQRLNSMLGDVVLNQLTQVVHTPTGQADRQALRSALVLSASEDQQVTLLEALENYPTPEVIVEGDRLLQTYEQVSRLVEQGQSAAGLAETIRQAVKRWWK